MQKFEFDPSPQRAKSKFVTPIISAAKSWTRMIAAYQLAIFANYQFKADHCYPRDTGRINLPLDLYTTLSMPGGAAEPCSVLRVQSEIPGRKEIVVLVYQDLSLLIAVQEQTLPNHNSEPLFEIFPVPLQMETSANSRLHPGVVEFVPPNAEMPELQLKWGDSLHQLSHQDCPSVIGISEDLWQDVVTYIIEVARSAAAAHISSPYIKMPTDGEPKDGVFGQDVAAPTSELQGKPFSWPDMLDWSSSTESERTLLTEHLQWCLNMLHVRNSAEIRDLVAWVQASRNDPGGQKHAQVHLRAFFTSGRPNQARQKELQKDLIKMMDSFRTAPDFRRFQGSQFTIKTLGKRKIVQCDAQVAARADTSNLTPHEMMETHIHFREARANEDATLH